MVSLHNVFFFKLYNARQWNLFFLSLELSFLLHKKSKYDDHFKEAPHRGFAFEIKEILLAAKRKKNSRMERQNIRFSYTSMNDTVLPRIPVLFFQLLTKSLFSQIPRKCLHSQIFGHKQLDTGYLIRQMVLWDFQTRSVCINIMGLFGTRSKPKLQTI